MDYQILVQKQNYSSKNGGSVNTLFTIFIIITIKGHIFQVNIMASEIYDNVNLKFCTIRRRNKHKRSNL